MLLYLEMSSVIPVFANDALDHLVWSFVLGVGVRPVACAVDTLEVLVVTEKTIKWNYELVSKISKESMKQAKPLKSCL